MNFGGTVLPFCNPCIGSTFQDMALSAWPLDDGKYGGILETDHSVTFIQDGFYGPTYKQRWAKDNNRKVAGEADAGGMLNDAGDPTAFATTGFR